MQSAFEALLNAAQRQSGLRDAVLGGTADIRSVVRILRIPPVYHHLGAVYSGEGFRHLLTEDYDTQGRPESALSPLRDRRLYYTHGHARTRYHLSSEPYL